MTEPEGTAATDRSTRADRSSRAEQAAGARASARAEQASARAEQVAGTAAESAHADASARAAHIRPAGPADLPAVRAVTDAAYHPYIARIGLMPGPMRADHAADVAAGRVYVTGEPVTGLVVVVAHADHLLLESVAVHPDSHGHGIGRRLLDFVEARARDLGLPEIRLYTHALMRENQTIYMRYGYQRVERRTEGPYDRVYYRKRLTGR